MKVSFIAGYGPITPDSAASPKFWRDDLGLPMTEIALDYWGTDDVPGVNAFAAWPLGEAAESCFGSKTWPELPRHRLGSSSTSRTPKLSAWRRLSWRRGQHAPEAAHHRAMGPDRYLAS